MHKNIFRKKYYRLKLLWVQFLELFAYCTITIFGKLPLQMWKNWLIFHIQRWNSSFSRSNLIYKFKCGGCNAAYYVKITLHFKVKSCCLCNFLMIEVHNLSLWCFAGFATIFQCKKHPWTSVTLSKLQDLAGSFIKSITPPWCFSYFLNCINDKK